VSGGFEEFFLAFPKTETHLHLEGALPWEMLRAANPGKYGDAPASWDAAFRFRDFAHFEGELLGYAGNFFTSAERYRECAAEVFRRRMACKVDYMEVSFASGCVDFMGLDGREVADAIRDAVPPGLEVRIFLGVHHTGWTPKMAPVLEEALGWDNLDGIDLHGPEDVALDGAAVDYWRRAREAGKATKAHAGEFLGAEFVRFVVEELGVRRVQHGVRAIEDPAVVELLVERGVALDVCPVSNVKLGVVRSAEAHPIRALMDAGVACTVSTDDPVSFGNDLLDDYRMLAMEAGFTRRDLLRVARHGFEVALVDEDWRRRRLETLDALAGSL
jgi:adenine deaminase